MDYNKQSLKLHKAKKGKIEIKSKFPLKNKNDLSVAYTPGVAAVSKLLAEKPELAREYSIKGNSVAVISDGSAVLGLGNIGPFGALPVMEGKALLFKNFANIDAYPICLNTQNTDEIVNTIKNIAPGFSGINLEDISAPRCFEIEERLQNELDIPVFHDDQHGTAIVILAALINAAKVVKKNFSDLKVVISGVGAAGNAVANLLLCIEKSDRNLTIQKCCSVKSIIAVGSKGIISPKNTENTNQERHRLALATNPNNIEGSLQDAMIGADVFIGVSAPNIVTQDMVRKMAKNPIIFAMANPIPEIMPEDAKKAGAKVVATGRSDFENQVNNVLAFPGIFRGALDAKAKKITTKMQIAAAYAIASSVKKPTEKNIIPSPLDMSVHKKVAQAVKKASY